MATTTGGGETITGGATQYPTGATTLTGLPWKPHGANAGGPQTDPPPMKPRTANRLPPNANPTPPWPAGPNTTCPRAGPASARSISPPRTASARRMTVLPSPRCGPSVVPARPADRNNELRRSRLGVRPPDRHFLGGLVWRPDPLLQSSPQSEGSGCQIATF